MTTEKRYNVTVYRDGEKFGWSVERATGQEALECLRRIGNTQDIDARFHRLKDTIEIDFGLGGKPSRKEYQDPTGYWSITIEDCGKALSSDGWDGKELRNIIVKALDQWFPAHHNPDSPAYNVRQAGREGMFSDLFINISPRYFVSETETQSWSTGDMERGIYIGLTKASEYLNNELRIGIDNGAPSFEIKLLKNLLHGVQKLLSEHLKGNKQPQEAKPFNTRDLTEEQIGRYFAYAAGAMKAFLSTTNADDFRVILWDSVAKHSYDIAQAMIAEERRRTVSG
jgi:hypothetical protein